MAKVQKDRARPRRPGNSTPPETTGGAGLNFGGFLGKLGSVVEKLAELAESGQNLSQAGELKGLDPQGKLRGVFGFSIKTALGDQGAREVKIEPFGNIRPESSTAAGEDIREPLVDVYEEDDHVLVLAEIPGVSKKDVQLELSADRLSIRAQRGSKSYRKDVTLPQSFSQENMHWECANGILKIRLQR
jgi:HSP20 family protein